MTTYAGVVKYGLRVREEKKKYAKFAKFSKCWVTSWASRPSMTMTLKVLVDEKAISVDELNNLYNYKYAYGKFAFFEMVVARYGDKLISKK